MRIILIHKSQLHRRPPMLTLLMLLCELGYRVTLISGGITPELRQAFEKKADIRIIPQMGGSVWGKIRDYISFRRKTLTILREFSPKTSVLFIENADCLLALGRRIQQFRYILKIQELFNDSRIHFRSIGRVIRQAELVFMPEYNRSVLYKIWFKLPKDPVVFPNKPYFLPDKEALEQLKSKYACYLPIFMSSKIILYQGIIHRERNLEPFIEAIEELSPEYKLLFIGKAIDDTLERYKQKYSHFEHIDFVPAPDYLLFTSLSYIGILAYDPYNLNTAYCAPNKIYEYAGYGLPMIGNNVPGLACPFAAFQMGEIVDLSDKEAIKQAVRTISAEYARYQANALRFFSNTDLRATLKHALENNRIFPD